MAGIYIGSTAGYSGKNMVVMGLGMRWQRDGLEVGYFKPVGAMPKDVGGKIGDDDAVFVQGMLGQSEDPELLTPVVVTQDFKVKAFSGQCPDYLEAIKNSYERVSKGKNITLVAGSGSMYSGKYCGVDGVTVVKTLGIPAIVIDRCQKELNYDFLVVLRETLGDLMAGVILNDIAPNLLEEVETMIKPFLERNKVKVLGIIPKDPVMGAIKVSDLAEKLGGKIISAHSKGDRIVESFLIGTMQVENFLTHFRRNKNAAIIVGGDRSDVQLVALEGECPCLVLTGNLYPNDIILTRSEVLEIPVIVVREDTYSVAKKMENILQRHKLRDVIKIQQGAQLISSSLDFDYLEKLLNLPKNF